MSITIGDAVLYIRGDTSRLKRDLAGVNVATNNTLNSAGNSLTHFLGNTLAVAAGGLLRDALTWIGDQVLTIGQNAIEAAGNFQMLTIQFEGLMARELAAEANRRNTRTETYQVTKQLTADEIEQLQTLTDKYDDATYKIAVMRDNLEKLRSKGKEGTAQFAQLAHNISELEEQMTGWQTAANALQGTQGQVVTLTRQILDPELAATAGDYLKEAQKPAKELLDWIKQIAVTTPFTVETLANTLAMSMAMGFTSGQAKDLTLAIGNFTAGMGLSDEHMQRIIYNFGQMRAQGKLNGRDLRDLTTSMVPVNDLLDIMATRYGVTREAMRDMLTSGEVSVDEFFKTFQDFANDSFPGAMERMSHTVQGVTSNIQDFIGSVLGVEVLGPIVQKFTDLAADGLQQLMSPKIREGMTSIGKVISELAGRLLDKGGQMGAALLRLAGALLAVFGIDTSQFTLTGFLDFLWDSTTAIGDLIDAGTIFVDWLAGLPQKIKDSLEGNTDVQNFIANIQTALGNLQAWWDESGPGFLAGLGLLGGAIGAIASVAAGLALDAIGTAIKNLSQALKDNGPQINEDLGKIAKFMTDNADVIVGFAAGFVLVQVAVWGVNGAIGALLGLLALLFAPVTILAVVVGILVGLLVYFGDQVLTSFGVAHTAFDSFVFEFWAMLTAFSQGAMWLVAQVGVAAVAFVELVAIFIAVLAQFPIWLSNVSRSILLFVLNFISSIGTTIWQIITIIGLALFAAVKLVVDWATGDDGMEGAGTKLVQGLLDGLQKKWVELTSWLSSASAAVVQSIKDAFNIKSPSGVMRDIGQNLMAGLALGIKDGINLPPLALQPLTPAITGMAAKAVNGQAGGGGEAAEPKIVNNFYVQAPLDIEAVAYRVLQEQKKRAK